MTSGNFHITQIDHIIINRGERQREQLPDIDILADSIRRIGLIHPPVVTRDFVLVSGERRIEACKRIGIVAIPVQFVDEVEPHVLQAIELEENIKRSNLTWQEECKAVYAYHVLRKAHDPNWTHERTGDAIGLGQQSVSDRLTVATEIFAGNDRVLSAPKYSTALGITERAKSRRDEEALTQLRAVAKVKTDEPDADSIINASFLEWAPVYDGPKFNFVHCDFPYGIGADSFNQGSAPTHGGYADDEDTYWGLCKCLADNLNRLTTESCHFMFWYSMHFYQSTLDYFHKHTDISFDPFPLVWMKSDNVGILPDPQRGPRRIYETALFGSRGDRKVVNAISNAYSAPTDRSSHMSIKPEPVLRNFFRMFIDETSLMLDPTCGSGSSVRAAESLNARYCIGVEINRDFAEGANRSLQSSRAQRRK